MVSQDAEYLDTQRRLEGGMNGLFMISRRYCSENSVRVTSVS